MGEVISLLAAFLTHRGTGELFRGRGHSGAKKAGGDCRYPIRPPSSAFPISFHQPSP